jgi:hypothetical protein
MFNSKIPIKLHGRLRNSPGVVNLIGGIRSVFGEAGLDRPIEAQQQAAVAPTAVRLSLAPVRKIASALSRPCALKRLYGRIRGEAGRQFSPHQLRHLRSGQKVPGLLPVRTGIVSSRTKKQDRQARDGQPSQPPGKVTVTLASRRSKCPRAGDRSFAAPEGRAGDCPQLLG